MKIKHFSILSTAVFNFEFTSTEPVCVIRGRYSDLALDLLREVIGDYNTENGIDRFDNSSFLVHADIDINNKNYSVCYIRNGDTMGNRRLAVNFKPYSTEYSETETCEFIKLCSRKNTDNSNVLINSCRITSSYDDRPIFIYNYFDRQDQSIDITPMLSHLSSLNRQVFISVCSNYPIEKLIHPSVQTVNI